MLRLSLAAILAGGAAHAVAQPSGPTTTPPGPEVVAEAPLEDAEEPSAARAPVQATAVEATTAPVPSATSEAEEGAAPLDEAPVELSPLDPEDPVARSTEALRALFTLEDGGGATEEDEGSITGRWWFWAVTIGVAIGAGLSIITAVTTNDPSPDPRPLEALP
jgi:hypothetical protein